MTRRIASGPDPPQPSAGRQLRLGHRRDLRARVPADGRRPRAPPGRPRRAPLHRSPPRLAASGAAGLRRSARGARRARPDRDRGWRLVRAGPRRPARARPGRSAGPDGGRARGDVRAAAARRVAGRAGLGAGPADGPGLGRLRLDGSRRRPLPGRGDPRGRSVGLVHDRRSGQGPDRLRHRAGPALPDPVRRGGRRHRLSPRPRDRGGRPARNDGRRRREVRRLADDLGALLG